MTLPSSGVVGGTCRIRSLCQFSDETRITTGPTTVPPSFVYFVTGVGGSTEHLSLVVCTSVCCHTRGSQSCPYISPKPIPNRRLHTYTGYPPPWTRTVNFLSTLNLFLSLFLSRTGVSPSLSRFHDYPSLRVTW